MTSKGLNRIASVYRTATLGLRTQILERLLRPVGPLALVALAAGAFGEILSRGNYRRLVVLPEDAARITGEQLLELLHYIQQHSPETIAQLLTDIITVAAH